MLAEQGLEFLQITRRRLITIQRSRFRGNTICKYAIPLKIWRDSGVSAAIVHYSGSMSQGHETIEEMKYWVTAQQGLED
jgi:hypothetical protein